MLRLAGITLAVLLMILLLRGYNSTLAVTLSIIGSALIFLLLSDKISTIVSTISDITGAYSQGREYITLMLRVLGVILTGQFLAGICSDNGENALSSMVELGTKILSLIMVLPLFDNIIQIVRTLTK